MFDAYPSCSMSSREAELAVLIVYAFVGGLVFYCFGLLAVGFLGMEPWYASYAWPTVGALVGVAADAIGFWKKKREGTHKKQKEERS